MRRTVLVSIVVVLAILGLCGVGLFAFLRKGDVDDQVTNMPIEGTVTSSDAVVELSSCAIDEVGDPVASGTLTNQSGEISGYLVSVAFEQGATRFDLVAAQLAEVQPGDEANWTATSFADFDGSFGCTIERVEHTAPSTP